MRIQSAASPGSERLRREELHVVGIDADAPLGRHVGERRPDPGGARLVLEEQERVGLGPDCSSTM